jgi:uncharacterized protein
MIFYLILFLSMSYVLLFFAHYFIFLTFNKFFNIDRKNYIWLAAALVLSASFVMASFFTNYSNLQAAKIIYYAVSMWHGVLVFLLISSALSWFVYFLDNHLKTGLPTQKLIHIFFAAALAVSIYGLLNAADPKIKNVEIYLDNLNEYWKDRTIVHISDVHMGAINGASKMEKIARMINNEKPDLVLITGDYFDGTCKKFEELAAPLKSINSAEGIYFANGNHEIYASRGQEASLCGLLKEVGVKCLINEKISINGLNIIGLDYPAGKESLSLLENTNPRESNILLYHEPSFSIIEKASKSSIDLQLAGHTHKGQLFPFSLFTRLIYGRYHYGLHTEGRHNIYTTSGAGTWGPPMRAGSNSEIVKIIIK